MGFLHWTPCKRRPDSLPVSIFISAELILIDLVYDSLPSNNSTHREIACESSYRLYSAVAPVSDWHIRVSHMDSRPASVAVILRWGVDQHPEAERFVVQVTFQMESTDDLETTVGLRIYFTGAFNLLFNNAVADRVVHTIRPFRGWLY